MKYMLFVVADPDAAPRPSHQRTVERALVHWPREGMPRSPAAWLATAARNRALDVLRRLGRSDEARRAYLAALQLAPAGQPEQRLLQRRLSEP